MMIFRYISAEIDKLLKSKWVKIAFLIALICSLFLILAMPKEEVSWRQSLQTENHSIEKQLNLTKQELVISKSHNTLILQWQINNECLAKNMKPETLNTRLGNLSQLMSHKNYGLILVVFPILFAVSIAGEFEKGTIKFSLFSPYSRRQIILSKFLSVFFISALFLMCVLILNFALNFIFLDSASGIHYIIKAGEIVSEKSSIFVFKNILLALPYYFAYVSFAFMLAVVSRSTAISLSISLFFALLGTQLVNLLHLSDKMLRFILPAIVDLTYYDKSTNIAGEMGISTFSCLITIFVYCFIFYFIAQETFKNRDI
ncbi:ABC transporter permease subunit [Listeria innocua]|uniref:ABC transporter permease n=1 Tax=Listeria innocua TaxID=1642 RepID=UPI001623EA7C|nr:ABC transporter permease subunit [Listeria innocua]MBC2137429.1 ABC transporter permease subunit [Listeria innocua]